MSQDNSRGLLSWRASLQLNTVQKNSKTKKKVKFNLEITLKLDGLQVANCLLH